MSMEKIVEMERKIKKEKTEKYGKIVQKRKLNIEGKRKESLSFSSGRIHIFLAKTTA